MDVGSRFLRWWFSGLGLGFDLRFLCLCGLVGGLLVLGCFYFLHR